MRASLMLVIALAAAIVGAPAQAAPPPNAPTLPIEQKYFAPGPFAVSMVKDIGCCDSSAATFDVWYPTDFGRSGVRHPIITWGNGTDGVPTQYAFPLAHLASWGFVVVASTSPKTASGREIADAARWMASQNDQRGSIFHRKLATTRAGAMGHSQGAAGVLNAMTRSNGLITTAIPIELPAQVFCGTSVDCPDTRKLTGGAIFLVNGSADALISPSRQALPAQLVGLQSTSAYYEAAPAPVTKVWATLNGPDHIDVQGQPDCSGARRSCVNGVYGYLGYPTAWMMTSFGATAMRTGLRRWDRGAVPGDRQLEQPDRQHPAQHLTTTPPPRRPGPVRNRAERGPARTRSVLGRAGNAGRGTTYQALGW